MPGQLKWVFCETPSSQVGKNFLPLLDSKIGERECFVLRVEKPAPKVLG